MAGRPGGRGPRPGQVSPSLGSFSCQLFAVRQPQSSRLSSGLTASVWEPASPWSPPDWPPGDTPTRPPAGRIPCREHAPEHSKSTCRYQLLTSLFPLIMRSVNEHVVKSESDHQNLHSRFHTRIITTEHPHRRNLPCSKTCRVVHTHVCVQRQRLIRLYSHLHKEAHDGDTRSREAPPGFGSASLQMPKIPGSDPLGCQSDLDNRTEHLRLWWLLPWTLVNGF